MENFISPLLFKKSNYVIIQLRECKRNDKIICMNGKKDMNLPYFLVLVETKSSSTLKAEASVT